MTRLNFVSRTKCALALVVLLVWSAALTADAAAPGAEVASPRGAAQKARQSPARPLDEQRLASLIQRMTLREKIGQMQQANGISGGATGDLDESAAADLERRIREGRLGSILNEVDPATINRLQRVAVEESRLGVPLVFGRDVIHGFRTVFPIPLGQAASWNPELVEQAAEIAAREARSAGVHWTFAPMVDVTRDPRWGRIAESLGEDPLLSSVLAAAMVRGFQGEDLAADDRIAACVKHFAAYGAAEGGRDYNTVSISPSLLRNVYLPPFEAAVDAGVATLMTSFNDVNGVPSTANPDLLRGILRKEWNFRGFVVSDWTSVEEMIEHGYCRNAKDAAKAAAEAGVGMEMVSTTYNDHLENLVQQGVVAESVIDELVAEVLRLKAKLGLWENPYVPASTDRLLTDEHLEAARAAARESIVLLKNEGKLLPLERSKIKKLAVIGPLADAKRSQLGTWIPDGREEDSRTPLAALRETVGDDIELVYVKGLNNSLERSRDGFADAVSAARDADAVLLFVGEDSEISGEAKSRAILELPGAQNALIEAVAETGKPIVLIVQAGRPLTIGRQIEQADAVLYCFHAGTMAGPAIADLVWGEASPSGKLPVTFPKSVGQVPLYYNHPNTGRPPRAYDFSKDQHVRDEIDTQLGYNSNYIDVSPYPLYPFGYGLSYTTFQYGDVELSAEEIREGESIVVRISVTNTGDVAAHEVVQCYVRDVVGSLVRPVRELKGFRKIRLAPGETKVVRFALSSDDLGYYNNEQQRVVEPGEFEIYIGGSSLAPHAGTFRLVGAERRAAD